MLGLNKQNDLKQNETKPTPGVLGLEIRLPIKDKFVVYKVEEGRLEAGQLPASWQHSWGLSQDFRFYSVSDRIRVDEGSVRPGPAVHIISDRTADTMNLGSNGKSSSPRPSSFPSHLEAENKTKQPPHTPPKDPQAPKPNQPTHQPIN